MRCRRPSSPSLPIRLPSGFIFSSTDLDRFALTPDKLLRRTASDPQDNPLFQWKEAVDRARNIDYNSEKQPQPNSVRTPHLPVGLRVLHFNVFRPLVVCSRGRRYLLSVSVTYENRPLFLAACHKSFTGAFLWNIILLCVLYRRSKNIWERGLVCGCRKALVDHVRFHPSGYTTSTMWRPVLETHKEMAMRTDRPTPYVQYERAIYISGR